MNEFSWKDPRTFKPHPLFHVETEFETLETFGHSSYATLLASLLGPRYRDKLGFNLRTLVVCVDFATSWHLTFGCKWVGIAQ